MEPFLLTTQQNLLSTTNANNPLQQRYELYPVYAIGSHAVSGLGHDMASHWQAVAEGRSALRLHTDPLLGERPYMVSRLEPAVWQIINAQLHSRVALSPFEQMALWSASQAIGRLEVKLPLKETVFILSATKGNIEWLGKAPAERNLLSASAGLIASALAIGNKPVVVSNACASGVSALLLGQRLLQNGRYKYAVVCGCDRITEFVLSGFLSLMALSDEPCRPFDANRNGINLGEAAATIILSRDARDGAFAQLVSGAITNDANHISSPSRTGDELALGISRTLATAGVKAAAVNMISAHGTATLYNDEMESKALRLAGLHHTPVHSLKGYTGHTLGAAGVLETAVLLEGMRRHRLIPSAGYTTNGVSCQLNVTDHLQPAPVNYVLKSSSGFGGCNAVALWRNIHH